MTRPDPLEPAQPDPLADDERIFDLQGNGSHIHSLDRCEHYVAGEEVGWLCGMLPMFTNIATANAAPGDIDDGEVVSCEPAETGWDILLRAREGGRLVIGHAANAVEAQYVRDTAASFIASWAPARIADLRPGDPLL